MMIAVTVTVTTPHQQARAVRLGAAAAPWLQGRSSSRAAAKSVLSHLRCWWLHTLPVPALAALAVGWLALQERQLA